MPVFGHKCGQATKINHFSYVSCNFESPCICAFLLLFIFTSFLFYHICAFLFDIIILTVAVVVVVVVMKHVSFSRTETVYDVDNYDRTSPWEIIARDRVRFKRRIEITEKVLSPILTESHRDLIRIKRLSVNS